MSNLSIFIATSKSLHTLRRTWRHNAPSLSWATPWKTAPGPRTLQPASASLSPSPSITFLLKVRSWSSAGWRWFEWQWREICQSANRPTAAMQTWTTSTRRKPVLIAHKGGTNCCGVHLKKKKETIHANAPYTHCSRTLIFKAKWKSQCWICCLSLLLCWFQFLHGFPPILTACQSCAGLLSDRSGTIKTRAKAPQDRQLKLDSHPTSPPRASRLPQTSSLCTGCERKDSAGPVTLSQDSMNGPLLKKKLSFSCTAVSQWETLIR